MPYSAGGSQALGVASAEQRLLAALLWQPAVTSWTVALVVLIRIFSCVIFLMDTWDFSQIPVFILCIMFFIASLIFAVIHYGRTQG